MPIPDIYLEIYEKDLLETQKKVALQAAENQRLNRDKFMLALSDRVWLDQTLVGEMTSEFCPRTPRLRVRPVGPLTATEALKWENGCWNTCQLPCKERDRLFKIGKKLPAA